MQVSQKKTQAEMKKNEDKQTKLQEQLAAERQSRIKAESQLRAATRSTETEMGALQEAGVVRPHIARVAHVCENKRATFSWDCTPMTAVQQQQQTGNNAAPKESAPLVLEDAAARPQDEFGEDA